MGYLILLFTFIFTTSTYAAFSDSVRINNFPSVQAVQMSGDITVASIVAPIVANIGSTNGLALESGHAASTDISTAAINSKITTTVNGLRVDASGTTLPVSIVGTPTVTANAGTNLNTSLLALDSTVAKDASLATLNTSINSLLKPASTLAAVSSITNTVTVKADTLANQTNALKVDAGSTSTLPLPTGAASAANQATELSTLSTIATNTANTTVTQATGTNLHTVIDSGSLTANAGTNLNTSALNLESTQSALNAKIPTLGQTTNALSLPVTIASDQTTAVGIKVDAESQILDFTSTNLAAGATYTSPWFDTNLYGAGANLYFTIDQPTTYIFEISPDQTIVNTMDTSSVLANVKFQETQYIPTRYWRVKLTNNGVAATTSLFLSSSSRKIPALEYTRIGDRAGNDLSLVKNLTTTTTTNAVPVDIKPNIQNTYHAVFVGAVTATTPTDVFTIAGAAGKKIRIKYVYVDGEQTTSSTIRVNLIKRSTLDTGGTSTVITPVASESSQAASSAVVRAYTANPTLGTAIGTFSSKLLRINVAGSTQTPVEFDSTNGSIKDMTLASATEQFAINFNSTTITGDLMAIDVIYTEE